MDAKRGRWIVNSRHKTCINGKKENKKNEDKGKIKKISMKNKSINRAKKRK